MMHYDAICSIYDYDLRFMMQLNDSAQNIDSSSLDPRYH